jgi:hypothetical protein
MRKCMVIAPILASSRRHLHLASHAPAHTPLLALKFLSFFGFDSKNRSVARLPTRSPQERGDMRYYQAATRISLRSSGLR